MSTRLPTKSTVIALVVSVVSLALLVVFVALGPDDGGSEGGLGDGFAQLSSDDFGKAVVDAQADAGSWRFNKVTKFATGPAQPVRGEVLWQDGAVAFRMTVDSTEGTQQLLLDAEGYLYIDNGAGGKLPWWKVDVVKYPRFQPLVAGLQKLADPEVQAAGWEATTSFEALGLETVNGVRTAHYKFEVPARDYYPAVSDIKAADIPADEVLTFDLWLDKRNQPVRLVTISQATNGGQLEETVDYTDYAGVPAIDAPPASSVTTVPPNPAAAQ